MKLHLLQNFTFNRVIQFRIQVIDGGAQQQRIKYRQQKAN